MTKDQVEYIKTQLYLIDAKTDLPSLNRYRSLLSSAALSDEVKTPLFKACGIKAEEFKDREAPLVVTAAFD